MLHEFVTTNRDEIIGRCRTKVLSRLVPPPTEAEINHGVPLFLDQLVDELRGFSANPAMDSTATLHGRDLRRQGLTVSQVVHDYGDVCQAITDMAVERNTQIPADDFRMLNWCLDNAIASAVTEFSRDDEGSVDGESNEGVGLLGKELRRSIHLAQAALKVVKSGKVGLAGSTGTLLDEHLSSAERLLDRLLAEVYARRSTDRTTAKGQAALSEGTARMRLHSTDRAARPD